MFNQRLSKTLIAHGHNVTLLIPLIPNDQPPPTPPRGLDEIRYVLPRSGGDDAQENTIRMLQMLCFDRPKLSQILLITVSMRELAISTQETILGDSQLMDRLVEKRIDLTMSHPFDLWSAGLSHRIGSKSYAYVAPGPFLIDHIYWNMGLPYIPSIIPNVMSKSADRMNFLERAWNSVYWTSAMLFYHMDPWRPRTENTAYRAPPYGAVADSDLWTLSGRAKAIFYNGEPVLDYVKPLVPTTFYFGDLERKKLKPLPEEWQKLVDQADEGIILFSFGTIANTSAMPLRLKEAFLEAFTKFPNHKILWRLEGEMPRGLDDQKHIKIVKWMPQRDLLFNPKMKLFITHGGYNSLLETSQAGVPLLFMPLFADQYSNAKRSVQRGIGLMLDKYTTTADEIEKSIRMILTNRSFHDNAKSLSLELKDHIMDNEAVAMRQIERVASNNRFWPTMAAAQRLNWIQYSCLDIIAFFLLISFVLALVLRSILFLIWRLIREHKSAKKNGSA